MQKKIQTVTNTIMARITADGRVCPTKFYLPEPKILSKGYWRSILFCDSSVLKTMKENGNQVHCDKSRQTTTCKRLKE